MELDQLLREATDAMAAGRVYGAPCERDGVTLIPAAQIRGGGGGGGGEGPEGKGSGGGAGFGLNARPVGAWVIRAGKVRWKPALDLGRLTWQLTALAAVWTLGALVVRRRRRQLVAKLGRAALVSQ